MTRTQATRLTASEDNTMNVSFSIQLTRRNIPLALWHLYSPVKGQWPKAPDQPRHWSVGQDPISSHQPKNIYNRRSLLSISRETTKLLKTELWIRDVSWATIAKLDKWLHLWEVNEFCRDVLLWIRGTVWKRLHRELAKWTENQEGVLLEDMRELRTWRWPSGSYRFLRGKSSCYSSKVNYT